MAWMSLGGSDWFHSPAVNRTFDPFALDPITTFTYDCLQKLYKTSSSNLLLYISSENFVEIHSEVIKNKIGKNTLFL